MNKYSINQKTIAYSSYQNQEKVKKLFKKEGFILKHEDKGKNKDKTIDFVFQKNNLFLLIEVKTIFSVDRNKNGEPISEYSNSTWGGSYNSKLSHKKPTLDSLQQYHSFIKNNSVYKPYPFILFLFPSFFNFPWKTMSQMIISCFPEAKKISLHSFS